MPRQRVLAIGLDGLEISIARALMDHGVMPNLGRLFERSARFPLDHGPEKYSGLSWEHVSLGLRPQDSGRWSAVAFDPATYRVRQEPTARAPFMAGLSARTVVFDAPYCDLARAPEVRGITNWGAHDPGVAFAARPQALAAELLGRFGPYPAAEHIYGFLWPSPEDTRRAAEALRRAVAVRTEAALWLLRERLPDWDLALVVVSEPHSVTEPMWHGVDRSHPLHGLPSSGPANQGIVGVYLAVDRLLGALTDAFPDAAVLAFAMHGMGANEADLPAMVLLPELLHRHAFGAPHLRPMNWAGRTASGVPLLAPGEAWHQVMALAAPPAGELTRGNLNWMPAARYAPLWPRMAAFALPAYYDGRIRINLAGREAHGIVPPESYEAVRNQIAGLVSACRDALTGEPAVEKVYTPGKAAMDIAPTEPDLYVVFRGQPAGFSHPDLGEIGPVPYRRTGGHTGAAGFLYAAADPLAPGDRPTASAFDVVPTILDLLGEREALARVSGASLLEGAGA